MVDADGKIVSIGELLHKEQTSNIIAMKLAHVPQTYCNGDLAKYRQDLASGTLQCGVADIESIFRAGIPLGSSVLEKIFSWRESGAISVYQSF